MFIPLLWPTVHLEVRTGIHFLPTLIRMTASVFHQFSRIKMVIEKMTRLSLSLPAILSHTFHIHKRRTNPRVMALTHLDLLFRHIIQGRRPLIIQSSTTIRILTTSTIINIRSIMEMG